MANISFQLNTTAGFTTAAGAITNWGTGNVITAWADMAGQDLANGETVYENNDENPDAASGTLSSAFAGNATDFFAFEKSDGTIAAVQIDAAGLVSALTTTTTTAAPQYTITVTPGLTVNEGDTFNVVFQYAAGGTTGLTVTGSATEADFTTIGWPAEIGAGNTTATLDFTGGNTVDLEFTVDQDASFNEGSENIIFTLTDGTTETVNITDSSTNQPPVAGPGNFTVQQNGTGNDEVTIDLSGTGVSDPENDALTWIITSLPGNGDLYDNALQNTVLSAVPYTITPDSSGDAYKVVYKPGAAFIGNTSFQYKVQDSNGQDSGVATISISVTPPQNQPPVATNVSDTFQAGSTVNKFFSREATDDDSGVTFEWCLNDGPPATIQTLAQINSALSHGTVTPTSGEGFVYTTTTILNPNDTTVSDIFYFKAIDTEGEEDIGQVQFQLQPPGNNPPQFNANPPSNAIEIEQGSAWTNSTPITATDPNGDVVTITIFSIGGSDTGAIANFSNGVLSVTGTQANETITVTLRATDEFGESGTDITYSFTVQGVPYRALKKSTFTNSDSSACSQERTSSPAYYYDTGGDGATFLGDLTTGGFLYTTSALTSKVIPTSNSNTWVSVEENIGQNVTIRAIKLSGAGALVPGAIEEILSCTVTGGAAWPILIRYAANNSLYCDGVYEEGEAWQNIADGATLTDVVSVGGQLFTSEYYANQYAGSIAPAEFLLENGIYNQADDVEIPSRGYYFYNSGWQSNDENPEANDPTNDGLLNPRNNLYVCQPDIVYQNKSIDVYWYTADPANIGSVCSAKNGLTWNESKDNFDPITIYYRQDVEDTDTWTLLDIAKNQTLVFISALAAENKNYPLLQPSSVLLDSTSGEFVLWDNENYTGYDGSYRWYAFSPDDGNSSTQDNLLEVATVTSVLGTCTDGIMGPDADYSRPALWTISNGAPFLIGNPSGSRNSMYYAFYGCETELNPGIPGGTPYYPVYIVDGMSDYLEFGLSGVSYINDFVNTITNSSASRAQIKTESGKCFTYTNAIIATNIEEAVSFMNAEIDGIAGDVPAIAVSINAIDLGFGSQANVSWKEVNQSDSTACYECSIQTGGGWSTYTFPSINNADILNRTIPNFDLEENYTLDNVSRPLLRTNPKLSTNAKLVANSTDQIFIESIDATKELASVEYKKWELNPGGAWSYDLYKFFKNNATPSDMIYSTRVDYSNFAVQDSFDKQIEEVYHYGTTYNYSKLHDEDLRMLAPIWLDKDIPKRFVIFRVNDPVGEMDFDTRSNFNNIQDILKNSEIVKTFDLTSESSLGKYIRNHVNSESFPKAPVQFNFAREEKSSFKGIDLGKGGFTSKGEYLYKDFVRSDNPLISSNALITDGFERNNLACANLINLEFLFDDNNAPDYSINRYFGLYVNDIDSGYGSLLSSNNGSAIFKSLNSYINESPDSAIPSFKQISSTPTLGYLSISDKFYKISPKSSYDSKSLNVIVEDSANEIPNEIKIDTNGNSIDIVKEDSAGFDFVKFSVTGTPAINDRFVVFESRESSYSIKFLRHIPNEAWTLVINNAGTVITSQIILQSSLYASFLSIKNLFANEANIDVTWDLDNKELFITEKIATLGDLEVSFTPVDALTSSSIAKVTQIQTSVNLDNSTFFATHGLESGTFDSTSFSLQGSNIDIARAMVGCINNSPINFEAIREDGSSEFYVKSKVKGYRLLQSGVLIPNANANDFITLENRDTQTVLSPNGLLKLSTSILNDNEVYYMSGGNSAGKSVLVTKDSVSDIVIGDMLPTVSTGLYNKVIDIVDDIERSNSIYKKLILEKVNTLESGEENIYADNIVKLGLFSAYDIHDMNFDFYDRSNSDLKELEYETSATINYEPERSPSNTLTVFGNDYDLTPDNYFSGISDILPEETLDEYNEIKLWSEYDRLEENNLKEFVVRSRVVPNINKWALKDSLTVREQPYYLNANEAFGRTNFSPDFGAVGRDRLSMTHEWFYMDSMPKYLQYNQLNDTFSYVNFLEGFQLTPAHFKSTSYNYFDKFMVSDGFEVKDQYGIKSFIKTNLKKKYTLISGGNDVSFANTVFKGIQVGFKNRKEFINDKATEFVKSSEFNGYKFSTLVVVNGGNNSNGISYEVIQNKAFKFVVFLITVSLDDLWIDGALNRKLLYEMNHSFVWDHEDENFAYSDVNLTGALNLNDINFSNPAGDDYLIAKGITHSNGTLPQFLDQISPDEDNIFGLLQVKVSDSSGDVVFNMKIESIDDQDQITLAEGPVDVNGGAVNVSNIAGYIQTGAEYVYKQGGKNAFTSILDQLSVSSVSDLLKLNSGEITYTTVEENGEILNNRFEIDFENGVEIIKESKLVTVSDEDKPKTFKLKQGTIGYNLTAGDTYYPFLVRHNGNYTVDTIPVVTFTDTYTHFKTNTLQTTLNRVELDFEEPMYKHSLTSAEEIKLARDYYKRYNRCKTAFNLGFIQDDGTHDSNWGIVKNHFYRKVNESNASGVTKLSSSTDKLPLYPLIGEVAIDKKDVNVFRSSWDKNYYTRALSGGLTEDVPGTFETKEERSYLGSTIMKVKDSYNMISFTTQTVKTQEEQDLILANDNNAADVVVFEDKKYVYLDFYITTTVKKLLSQDGVLDSINRFVAAADSAGDKTTTKDDALLYVENNLLNAFNLDIIKIYTSRIKGSASEVLSSASIANLDDGGYSNDTNFTFKSHEQKPLNFRLIYNKRLGYSYRIKPMIKIQS